MESKPSNEEQGYLKPYMVAVMVVGALVLIYTISTLPREALNQRYLLLATVTLIVIELHE